MNKRVKAIYLDHFDKKMKVKYFPSCIFFNRFIKRNKIELKVVETLKNNKVVSVFYPASNIIALIPGTGS